MDANRPRPSDMIGAALLFLFLRFLPMISIFEMRTILPQAKVDDELKAEG